jgi:DNA-binding SARP family transcriptional activator
MAIAEEGLAGRTRVAAPRPGPPVTVQLLGGFEVRSESGPVPLPMSAQRLVSFLALRERPVLRLYVAGNLWLDSTEDHSAGCLRSALWRLSRPGYAIVETAGNQLRLAQNVEVDVREAGARARRLVSHGGPIEPGDLSTIMVSGDILPDWYEDWVVIERERFRQIRIHALEAMSARLRSDGRYAEAVEAGLAALQAEPLRESAHRAVISAHLAEGNVVEALRQYSTFRRVIRKELGLEPSPAMEQLLQSVRSDRWEHSASVTKR